MADDKDLKKAESIFDRLDRQQRAQERTAYRLNEAFEKLCNESVDEMTQKLGEAAKALKLLNTAQAKALSNEKGVITSARDLADALEEQEKKLGSLMDRYQKQIDKASKGSKERQDRAKRASDEWFKRQTAEMGLGRVSMDEMQRNIKTMRENATTLLNHGKAINDSVKAVNEWKDSLISSVKRVVSLDYGIKMAVGGLKQMYGEFNKLTSVGLQGSFGTISMSAMKLSMKFDEMSDIINQNRDIIGQLGGGNKGIEDFTVQLKDLSGGLAHMGKDGVVATNRFLQTLKAMNVNRKDGAETKKNMQAMQNQFRVFNAVYGDSAEAYANLIETQVKSHSVQSRIIGLGKSQIGIVQAEILARTENLKKIGMSNEQIGEFNRKLEDLYNPEKRDENKLVSESVAIQNLAAQINRQDPNGKLATPEMQAKLQEFVSMTQRGVSDVDMGNWKAQNADFAEAYSTGIEKLFQAQSQKALAGGNSLYDQTVTKDMIKSGGSSLSLLRDQGTVAAQNTLKGTNYANKPDEYAAMVKKSVDENEKNIDSLIKLRDTIQKVDAIMDSSIAKIAGGGLIAVFSVTMMAASGQLGRLAAAAIAAAKALFGVGAGGNLPDINGDGPGGKGKGGKKGGWKGKLGGLGKLGGAAVGVGMAGYEAYSAYDDYAEGKTTDTERNSGYGAAIGGGVGGIAGGAAAGAAVGMLGGPFAPVTVPIAALIGGGLGYWGGSALGEKAGSMTGTGTKRGETPPKQQQTGLAQTGLAQTGLAQTDLGSAVAKAESGKAGYGAFNRNRAGDARGASLDFSQMSINEVLRRQSLPSSDPDKLLAVGRYQFIKPTLLEGVNALKLDKNMPFTNAVQDQLFQWDAMKKRKKLGAYLNGSVEDNDANRSAALKDLSSEWMAFATPGSSSAATSVAGNKASVMNADALGILQRSRQQLASAGYAGNYSSPNLQQLQQLQRVPSMGSVQTGRVMQNYNGSMVGGAITPLPQNSDVSVISGRGGPQAMELDELRKQTQLLAQVAQNTAGKGSIARPNDGMYKRPPSEVANNMAS